jgi:hypothetical protein
MVIFLLPSLPDPFYTLTFSPLPNFLNLPCYSSKRKESKEAHEISVSWSSWAMGFNQAVVANGCSQCGIALLRPIIWNQWTRHTFEMGGVTFILLSQQEQYLFMRLSFE